MCRRTSKGHPGRRACARDRALMEGQMGYQVVRPMRWSRRVLAAAVLTFATFEMTTAEGANRRQCRERCSDAIARCVLQGYREASCTREVRSLCRHGSTLC